MAGQTTQSSLLAKLGGSVDKVLKTNAGKEPEVGTPMRLPPGIRSGVAQLTKVSFGEYKSGPNQGKLFCHMMGTVHEPKKHEWQGQVHDTEGAITSQTLPLCETKGAKPRTAEDNARIVQDWFKVLGASEKALAAGVAAFEPVAEALTKAKPFFRFSTSLREGREDPITKKRGEDGTWENWHTRIDDYSPAEGTGIVDETAGTGEGASPPDSPVEYDDRSDIDSLMSRAEDTETEDGEQARNRLQEMAEAAGWSAEDVAGAADWAAVREMIENPKTADEPAADPEPEAFVPKKGNVYLYHPIDPKTKKPVKKGIELEVLSVDPKNEVVTAKNLTTGKTEMDPKTKKPVLIKWSDLSGQ